MFSFFKGGQRSWIHVLCNGGMATQLGMLYLLDVGCGERPIDFSNDYRPSWLAMGILGMNILLYFLYPKFYESNKSKRKYIL